MITLFLLTQLKVSFEACDILMPRIRPKLINMYSSKGESLYELVECEVKE